MRTSINDVLSKLDPEDRELLHNELNTLETKNKKTETLIERSPTCTKIIDLDRRLKFMSCAGVTAGRDRPAPPTGWCATLATSSTTTTSAPVAIAARTLPGATTA